MQTLDATPVSVPDVAPFLWLEQATVAHEERVAAWLGLVAAAQRDFGELCRQLPAGALANLTVRAAGEAVDLALSLLRDELAAVLS